jgi:type IV pilus assembly protein PilN
MIRINLLSAKREKAKKSRGALIPAAHRVTIGASVILVATVLGIGWWFWLLHQRSASLDRDIAKAEADTQKLRGVLGQVQKFEARKAQLQQRVTLIEQLRSGQSASVHVLDKVSRSLPDRLWLTELKQSGQDITINGFGTSMTALSDFIANLENTNRFKKPVEIVDSQAQSDKKTDTELVRFSIKAVYFDPDAPQTAAPAQAAKPGGRGRGAGRGAN